MKSIIFIHIPKTAGTAFYNAVAEGISAYTMVRPKGLKHFTMNACPKPAFVRGHIPYGFHQFKPFQSFDYISFFRDPIKRAISHYYFVREAKREGYEHPEWRRHHETPLKNIFDDPKVRGFADLQSNLQTRMLAGVQKGFRNPASDKRMLEIAKNNLKNKVKVFGIQEDFERSVHLFGKTFGWKTTLDIGNNWQKTKNKPTIDDVTMRSLENAHQLDLELYEFAKKRFEKLL
ncbi:MAG: sulfotransferase family 2 domain-containing protein [Bacteroidota bacterium]